MPFDRLSLSEVKILESLSSESRPSESSLSESLLADVAIIGLPRSYIETRILVHRAIVDIPLAWGRELIALVADNVDSPWKLPRQTLE